MQIGYTRDEAAYVFDVEVVPLWRDVEGEIERSGVRAIVVGSHEPRRSEACSEFESLDERSELRYSTEADRGVEKGESKNMTLFG